MYAALPGLCLREASSAKQGQAPSPLRNFSEARRRPQFQVTRFLPIQSVFKQLTSDIFLLTPCRDVLYRDEKRVYKRRYTPYLHWE